MKRIYLANLIVVTTILAACSSGALAQTSTFTSPSSSAVTYTVPNGVTSIGVDMAGASGGIAASSYGNGGKGGRVQATLAVSSGQVLSIYVGGVGAALTGSYVSGGAAGGVGGCKGGNSGNYYYPAGGGGSSEVRIGGNRIVVAGGGGGAGSADCSGGSSGENGGDGGGLTGATGQICASTTWSFPCYNPTGGSQTAGGEATCNGAIGTQTSGSNGLYYAGGGGGGYWGGGGGYEYAGGGGGSSYPAAAGVVSGITVSNLTHTQGYQLGSGYVTICAPNIGSIFGNTPVCTGAAITLVSTGSGGAWSTTSSLITIGGTTGVVTGVSAGTAVVTYSASVAGCGSGFVTTTITVNPAPTAIIGSPSVCPGLTTTLTDGGGGSWSSSNPTLATIGSGTGIVTGITAGALTMTYTLITGCHAQLPFVVNPLPSGIGGTATVCASGGTTSLGDVTPGGSWSSGTTSVATIGGTGIVTGVTAGSSIIIYTLPTSCNATIVVTVNPLPSAITGTATVCAGSTTTLSDVGGGTWSSSNSSLAAVVPATGVVTGVSAGTPSISYTLPTGCSISTPLLVNPLPAAITGTASMCVGGSTTLSNTTPGGVWTSSNLTFATVVPGTGAVTGISSGSATISYILGTSCSSTRAVAITPLPTAFSVTGGGGYCVGTSGVHVGLSFGSSGIIYKLYNGATLVSSLGGSNSGLDFGLQTSPGTYTVIAIDGTTGCTNNMAGSVTVTINPLPNIYTVSGGGNYCAGGTGMHITQSGSDAAVNYQLFVSGIPTGAPVAGTGSALDFGPQLSAGTYTVVATIPATGCSVGMAGSAAIGINPAPTAYTLNSGGAFCAGGAGIDIVLSGSDISTNYQLIFGGSVLGAPMAGTGLPLNFGLHTAPGIYTVTAVNPAACAGNMSGSTTIAVNPLPIVYAINGGGTYCAGGTGVHVGMSFSNTGINYQLYRSSIPVGSPMSGTNSGLDFGLQTTAGTYTVVAIDQVTACTKNMSGSVVVSTTPLPNAFAVTGGGNYCAGGAGLHVGLSGSNAGIHYQLYNGTTSVGPAVSGTGAALDFGIQAATGTYTIVATSITTSCSNNMTGSVTISVNPLPNNTYVVTGAGTSYCAGTGGIDVTLSASDPGISYQLYRSGVAVGLPMAGTGTLLDYNNQTTAGTYTVTGRDLVTGCSINMTGSAVIVVNPLPNIFTVTGGGSYCAGGIGVHIGLSGSNTGINYQLFNSGGAVGGPVAGTGSAIDFGYNSTVDIYTVVATDVITNCTSTMTGTATVAQNLLPPVHLVTGGGNYCLGGTGTDIGLDGSEPGIMYQLVKGTSPSGSAVTGGGSTVDFGNRTAVGTYTVIATDPTTSCTNNMSGTAVVGTNPLPVLHNVTGGGIYCIPGGSGVNVNLDGSDAGITYQLYYLGSATGDSAIGTGSSLGFGLQTGVGAYNVKAVDATTGCSDNMSSSATVSTNPQPTVESVVGGGGYCIGGTGRNIGLSATDNSIRYQLYNGGIAVGAMVTGTSFAVNFGSQTAPGTYTVVASPGGVCATTMSGSVAITINPLPNPYTLTGGGSYCNGGTGVDIGLSGSVGSVIYQLYLGTATAGSPMTGTGSALDFGLKTGAGTYTLIATDTVTTCSTTMGSSGSVTINSIAAPTVYNVSGGGSYCSGGPGVHVTLAGSTTNVNYQLYNNGASTGSAMPGTGTLLDFGLETATGPYTIIGTDAATLCVSNMADTATVSVNPVLTPVVSITPHPGLNIVTGQRDTLTASATSGGGTDPTYQWLIGGFPVQGATNSMFISHTFADHDSVTCQITSSGDCGGNTSSRSVIINVRNTTGVQQITSSDINVNVIPNPNKGIFSIVGSLGTNNDEEVTLEVTDLLGHVVYNNRVTVKNGDIDQRVQLNNTLANGMYLLNLRSGSDSKVFHVVIEQ